MKFREILIMFKIITWPFKLVLFILGVIPFAKCSSGYSKQDGKIMFDGKEITDKSFVVLSNEFAKDSVAAYYKGTSIAKADLASFVAVDEHYAKDKSKVYYCDEYREGQNYYMTKRQQVTILKDARAASFISIDNGYGKDAHSAWFGTKSFNVQDLGTLTSIDRNFTRDDMRAYLDGRQIEGSNGKSFELIDGNYARDKDHIYYYAFDGGSGHNIATLPCDPKTFQIIDYRFSKDADKVFFLGFTLQGADARSFETLKAGYSKDKNAVYFNEKKIAGVNPSAFQVYAENETFNQDVSYAKDDTGVFVNDKKVVGAELSSFRLLGENYAADKQHIFYKTQAVKNADPNSFKVYPHDIGNADSEDARHKFHEGKLVLN